jgi:hypothetical protein
MHSPTFPACSLAASTPQVFGSGCLLNLRGNNKQHSWILPGVPVARSRVICNLHAGDVVGRTFDLFGIEIPESAHIPPPAVPTVARRVMPLTIPPRELTMIDVAAECLRAQWGSLLRPAQWGSLFRRAQWVRSSKIRSRSPRCAKAENDGAATSINASATIIG